MLVRDPHATEPRLRRHLSVRLVVGVLVGGACLWFGASAAAADETDVHHGPTSSAPSADPTTGAVVGAVLAPVTSTIEPVAGPGPEWGSPESAGIVAGFTGASVGRAAVGPTEAERAAGGAGRADDGGPGALVPVVPSAPDVDLLGSVGDVTDVVVEPLVAPLPSLAGDLLGPADGVVPTVLRAVAPGVVDPGTDAVTGTAHAVLQHLGWGRLVPFEATGREQASAVAPDQHVGAGVARGAPAAVPIDDAGSEASARGAATRGAWAPVAPVVGDGSRAPGQPGVTPLVPDTPAPPGEVPPLRPAGSPRTDDSVERNSRAIPSSAAAPASVSCPTGGGSPRALVVGAAGNCGSRPPFTPD